MEDDGRVPKKQGMTGWIMAEKQGKRDWRMVGRSDEKVWNLNFLLKNTNNFVFFFVVKRKSIIFAASKHSRLSLMTFLNGQDKATIRDFFFKSIFKVNMLENGSQ